MPDTKTLSRVKGGKKEAEKKSKLPADRKKRYKQKKEGKPETAAKGITMASDKLAGKSETYKILAPWIA
jgi:hypothetical protein